MSHSRRTMDDLKMLLKSCVGGDSQQTVKFYNSWADTYEQDLEVLKYSGPHLAVDFLNAKFSANHEEVQVLDVACGSGMVAKLMFDMGFRHFVGVDGSKGMLECAAKTGLYQDLRLALLGQQPLPAQAGVFDVVIIVGALDVGFVPVSVVRELCHATKPGGFICMVRGHHRGTAAEEYRKDLERELQLMEGEELWSLIAVKQSNRYLVNLHQNAETDKRDTREESYISLSIYLYEKSVNQADQN